MTRELDEARTRFARHSQCCDRLAEESARHLIAEQRRAAAAERQIEAFTSLLGRHTVVDVIKRASEELHVYHDQRTAGMLETYAALLALLPASPPETARADETRGTLAGESPLPCRGCGGPHRFDTTVPDVLWNRVIRARDLPEYLCTTCVVREFAKAGVSFTAALWGDEFYGLPIHVEINGVIAESAHAAEEENNDLRSRLFQLGEDVPASPTPTKEPLDELDNPPPIFLCQVCDQTPERGHAPDCPGSRRDRHALEGVLAEAQQHLAAQLGKAAELNQQLSYYHDIKDQLADERVNRLRLERELADLRPPNCADHPDAQHEWACLGCADTQFEEQVIDAAPYLKDGETVVECIERHRKDIDALMTLLAKEKSRAETLIGQLKEVMQLQKRRENRLWSERQKFAEVEQPLMAIVERSAVIEIALEEDAGIRAALADSLTSELRQLLRVKLT